MDYTLNLSDSVELFLLNDEFNNNRAAGAVNGTSAEPTGGTRTVTDTNGKLSITAGGVLNFATGGSAAGNPGLWYPSLISSTGKILTGSITPSSGQFFFGQDSNQTSYAYDYFYFAGSSSLRVSQATAEIEIGGFTLGNNYQLAMIKRAAGNYFFIKGGAFTNWTLAWIASVGGTAYPSIGAYNTSAVGTADNIRIPTSTWLPTPLAYDTFTRADGAIGSSETTGPDSQTTPSLAWTGGAISSNKNVITPSLGSEMWDAPASAFDSGTYAWTPYGTNTITNDTNSLKITYVDNIAGAYSSLNAAGDLNSNLTIGMWYQYTGQAKVNAGSSVNPRSNLTYDNRGVAITSTDFTNFVLTDRSSSATGNAVSNYNMGTGEVLTLDNLSLKPLTLSSLFSSVSTSDKDVIASADVTLTAGTQAGVVTNLDSAGTPANFLIAYHDGTYIKLDKNVGGTYTNLISATTNYVAGTTLRVITYHSDANTLKVRVYYNNALRGTEQTVTDAGIISNTLHGLFSTYSGNTFDNFTLFARGSDGEYNDLDDTRGISETITTEIRKFLFDNIDFSESTIKKIAISKLEDIVLLEVPVKNFNISKIENQIISEKVANKDTISFFENLLIVESVKLGQDRKLIVGDSLIISEFLVRTGDTLRLAFVENVNLLALIDSACFIRRAADTAFIRTNYP